MMQCLIDPAIVMAGHRDWPGIGECDENGCRTGHWWFQLADGIAARFVYRLGIIDGPYRVEREAEDRFELGILRGGVLEGPTRQYRGSTLVSEEIWFDGSRNGRGFDIDVVTDTTTIRTFRNGLLHGEARTFRRGLLLKIEEWSWGELVSTTELATDISSEYPSQEG